MELSNQKVYDRQRDRLSELPRDLQHHILSSMPICDAARTSILSSNWRFIWTKNPKISFDSRFLKDSSMTYAMSFIKIVSDVLLMHEGPIRKFSLHFPFAMLDLTFEIDRWLLFLSKNGIVDLELDTSYLKVPYKLPSSIFLCETLTNLSLSNCILKTPNAFHGFQTLLGLYLENVSVDSSVSSNLLLNARELQRLAFVECTGIQHLRIRAPKLVHIRVFLSYEVKWQWFKSNQQLETVEIMLLNVVQRINLGNLLGDWSKVRTLCLKGFSLKSIAARHVSTRLPTPAQNMIDLSLSLLVSDLEQISCCLCLLRSSPNLEKLKLNVACTKINTVDKSVMHILEASESQDMKLEKLKAVKIVHMQGHKAEMLLIKLLLGCSTSLEKMIIELITETDIGERYRVAKEVSSFSRASPKAKVIFFDPHCS